MMMISNVNEHVAVTLHEGLSDSKKESQGG